MHGTGWEALSIIFPCSDKVSHLTLPPAQLIPAHHTMMATLGLHLCGRQQKLKLAVFALCLLLQILHLTTSQ
jgi:hypothetical protein